MKYISLNEMNEFKVGNVDLKDAGSGCTVILPKHGAVCGVDIRGGGPASRESALLNPLADNSCVNAVLLSGGSAFGLNAAGGVMKYLEERSEGFPTANGVVPIVCASCIYDLGVARSDVRPAEKDGYQACLNAGNFMEGCHGAGMGATVGDILGPQHSVKSGIGYYGVQCGDLKMAAVVVVNAFGDVIDETSGKIIAGAYDENGFVNTEEKLFEMADKKLEGFEKTNTTIGAILTNAAFNKTQLTKIAGMANDGYARAIHPVHTMFDGDSIYALSNGTVSVDLNIAGSLAAYIMSRAVVSAIRHSTGMYNLKAASDLHFEVK